MGGGVPWSQLRKGGVEPVCRAIEAADEETQREIGRDCRASIDIAGEGGVKTIIDGARDPHHSLDLAKTLGLDWVSNGPLLPAHGRQLGPG